MVNGTFKHDSQELLSLSMDRLKEYMKKWDALGAGDGVLLDPAVEAPRRRSTRVLRRTAHPEVLLVRPDPLVLSQLITTNDRELLDDRLALSWASDFGGACAKMAASPFQAVAVFASVENVPDCEGLSGVDFLLLLGGLQPGRDGAFLLRKRAFLRSVVPGRTDADKVAAFRALKERYRSKPFLYVHPESEETLASVARRIHGVRTLALEPSRILATLREAVV